MHYSSFNFPNNIYRPVLIIAPASVRYHWREQLLRWIDPEDLIADNIIIYEAGGAAVAGANFTMSETILAGFHMI